jgi:hypothetical protein
MPVRQAAERPTASGQREDSRALPGAADSNLVSGESWPTLPVEQRHPALPSQLEMPPDAQMLRALQRAASLPQALVAPLVLAVLPEAARWVSRPLLAGRTQFLQVQLEELLQALLEPAQALV